MVISNEQQSKINSIKWFHHYNEDTFGFKTIGEKGIANKEEVKMWGFTSELFKDKTVLDIGAWDGYNSFYAEKLGAKRILAIDNPSWSGNSWGTKEGFDLVHEILKSNVESLDINLFDISSKSIGTFDTVLFLGVLYHLLEPLKGLQKAAEVTKDLLIVETTCEYRTKNDPIFIYKPEAFRTDDSSHYSLNRARLEELLINVCGFRKVIIKHWLENNNKNRGRVICYAYK